MLVEHKLRKIKKVLKGKHVIEGAGVHLKRVFGFSEVNTLDPFLLLDNFHSSVPQDYIKGFPWHPHRGIETITYLLEGSVEHADSLGNKGIINAGDVQWMTAGSGIIHQEMPKGDSEGKVWGFQLWANLPASQKMTEPKYRDLTANMIPVLILEDGTIIKIICGNFQGTRGPVQDIVIDPELLDISVPAESEFSYHIKDGHTAFAYVIGGKGYFDLMRNCLIEQENLVIYDNGSEIKIATEKEPVRFLLVSGKPLNEPVAWYGPIVMNTQAELKLAFEEYQNGTFIKK